MDNTIDIKGITRSTSMLQSEDGESEDLLNLRYKDGSWRIAGKGDEVYKLPADYKRLYIHTNVYRHLLGIKDNWLWWIADIDSDGYFKTLDQAIQLCNATESMHISQTGNLLTVIDGENRNYILWDVSDKAYHIESIDYNGGESSHVIPPTGNVQFRFDQCGVVAKMSSGLTYDGGVLSYNQDAAKGAYYAVENYLKERNCFVHPRMACIALELYDGSYSFMSSPELIAPFFEYYTGKVKDTGGKWHEGGKWGVKVNVGGTTVGTNEVQTVDYERFKRYRLYYNDTIFDCDINRAPSIFDSSITVFYPLQYVYGIVRKLQVKFDKNTIQKYKDIISKVCIFITEEVNPLDYDNSNGFLKFEYDEYEGDSLKDIYRNYSPRNKSLDTLRSEFKSSLFYCLKKYNIDDITGDWQTVEIDDGVLSNITQQDRLPIDASDRSAYYPKYSYSYNGRLHLANYMQEYFLGWPLNYFYGTPGNGMYDVNQETSNRCELCTAVSIGETSMVVRRPDDGDSSLQGIHYPYDLMPMLSYPSNEAKKMRVLIWYEQEINGKPYKKVFDKTYDLTPHEFYNFSYYITEDFRPIQIEFAKSPSSISIPESESSYNYYPNGLKVSSVDNPLVFPSSSTYLVGSSEIVGMCSNTIAVGTGQTGSAPLYVFSKDGIYALFVDSSGEMTYTNARPIARDVCDNPDSITPIDDGVVFTTGRGLMIISGESVREISEPLEGDFLDFANQESANGYIKMASNAFSNVLLGSFESNELVKEVFLDYIKNSIIAYNHSERELMVANPSTGYMYVMDRYGNWSRRSDNAKEFINNYPVTYRYENNILYSVHSDNCTYANVFMLTRAVKLGTVNFKQGYRFVLRGYFETTGIPLESSSASGSVNYATTSIFAGMYGYDSVGWYGKVMFPGKSYRISYKNMGVNPVKVGVGLKTYDDKILWDLLDDAYCDPGGSREFTVELPTTKYDIFKVEKVCLFVSSGSDEPVGDYSVEYEVFDMSSYAGLYVFGSYDGRRWAFIGGNEKSGAFTDFGCLVSRVDCKFFRACLCGMLSSSSRIDYMEMVSDGSRILGKKIR